MFWNHIRRQITILVIPQTRFKPIRWQCSVGFFLFCLVVWTGITVWAGFLSGRHVDYWITKADNKVMKSKMVHLAQEMDESRRVLEIAAATDGQLRDLLDMPGAGKDDDGGEAVGGPTMANHLTLQRMLKGDVGDIDQAEWHRHITAIRKASQKRLASFQEISWYMSNQRSLFHAIPNMWPTGGRITSLYGYRFSPMRRQDGHSGEMHKGIDIANTADTLIYATADGTVRKAAWSTGYGRMILIDHGYGISTLYAHTSKALVKAGDRVRRGQVIAYMGTTGRSTGAHLHYEVWRHGKPVNPMKYLKVRSDVALRGGPVKATGR